MEKLPRSARAWMARCLPIVVESVNRQEHRFEHIVEVSKSDLVNQFLLHITERRGNFDSQRGKISTWINCLIARRISDLVKVHTRSRHREHAVAVENSKRSDTTMLEPKLHPGELAAELRHTYQRIAANLERYTPTRGRPWICTPAQRLAICWLKRHLQITDKELAERMTREPALCQAIDLSSPPDRRTIGRYERAAAARFKLV
jgi:hypothetical protein